MTPVNGLGGWLLVLSRVLILGQPIVVGLTTAQTLGGLTMRERPVAVLVVARALAAAFGVAAGLALNRQHRGAVRLTKLSLLVSAAIEMIVYLTPSYPSSRGPGETPVWMAGTLLFYGGWYGYLAKSKRVRATFPGTNGGA
jgi:hypothetical protein